MWASKCSLQSNSVAIYEYLLYYLFNKLFTGSSQVVQEYFQFIWHLQFTPFM